jgi:DNA repair ATPase RecN
LWGEGKKMTDQSHELLAYIQSRLAELNTIHEQAEKALNAVQGKDHVTKWKRKVVEELTPFVSPAYLQHLSTEWLETTYFVGDVFDELSDEVDMCRRHLKKLAKDIQSSGIP